MFFKNLKYSFFDFGSTLNPSEEYGVSPQIIVGIPIPGNSNPAELWDVIAQL